MFIGFDGFAIMVYCYYYIFFLLFFPFYSSGHAVKCSYATKFMYKSKHYLS